MEIKINNRVSVEIANTYLYSLKIEGYTNCHNILWSEEYAKERSGKHTWDNC